MMLKGILRLLAACLLIVGLVVSLTVGDKVAIVFLVPGAVLGVLVGAQPGESVRTREASQLTGGQVATSPISARWVVTVIVLLVGALFTYAAGIPGGIIVGSGTLMIISGLWAKWAPVRIGAAIFAVLSLAASTVFGVFIVAIAVSGGHAPPHAQRPDSDFVPMLLAPAAICLVLVTVVGHLIRREWAAWRNSGSERIGRDVV